MNDYITKEQRLGRKMERENTIAGKVFTLAVIIGAAFLLGFIVHARMVLSALGY